MPFWRVTLTALLILGASCAAVAESSLQWRGWSPEVLSEARTQKRFIILDLEAVWCHWCHVMEETTYRDPKVVALLKSNYITVRVDQDANPDLSARYGDWGWPATIIFAPDGSELVKRRGYIEPENMASLLQAVIDDPTPGPSVTANEDVTPAETTDLGKQNHDALLARFSEAYDDKNGGWGNVHKFIDADSMDWALAEAERGNAKARTKSIQTLDAALALIDPVDGGLYQYSDKDDWSSPHYEKIMWYQANGLRQYASAYALYRDAKYLTAAQSIYGYMTSKLLSPNGAFYATQDADVDRAILGKTFYAMTAEQRQKLGREPRIDKNLYARENGWAISALVAFANVAKNPEALAIAERAADWVVANRRGPDGHFSHGDKDRGGPFLGDAIAMTNASLDLYAATGNRKWLDLARDTGVKLSAFKGAGGGFVTSMVAEGPHGVLGKPFKNVDEQVQVARVATRLWRYLGIADAKALADHAMKYLASSAIIASGRAAPGLLLADQELNHEPTHITVVGKKDDGRAMALHAAARSYPAMNKRIDWWDTREGPMANGDVTYPEMNEAAAFACSNRLCSLPAFNPEELNAVVAQILRRPTGSASK